MRHHRDRRKLSRTAEHRRALLRNLVTALFEYERIETTVAKAKETRRVAERMITYAKRNNLHSRRLVARVVQKKDVAQKLFETITPWYTSRQGGYTRILKTRKRLGDGGEMAILELVKTEEQKEIDRKARADKAEEKAKKKKLKEEEEAAMMPPTPEPEPEKKEEKEKKAEKEEAKAKKAKPKAKKEKPDKEEAKPKPKAKKAKPKPKEEAPAAEKPAPKAKKAAEKKAAEKKPAAKKPKAKEEKPAEKKPKKRGLLSRIRRKKSED